MSPLFSFPEQAEPNVFKLAAEQSTKVVRRQGVKMGGENVKKMAKEEDRRAVQLEKITKFDSTLPPLLLLFVSVFSLPPFSIFFENDYS